MDKQLDDTDKPERMSDKELAEIESEICNLPEATYANVRTKPIIRLVHGFLAERAEVARVQQEITMELSIKDIRELLAITSPPQQPHPLIGQKVVAVLPSGFVHVGTLHEDGGQYVLTDAFNLRYWAKRDGGLPQLAQEGLIAEDKTDHIQSVYFDAAVFFYPCGEW